MAGDYDKDIAALRDDFQKLRDDLATLAGKARDDAASRAQAGADNVRDTASQAAERAADELRAHPFAAAAAAFGVGFLLGALIERR